jgi:hypothetical protein
MVAAVIVLLPVILVLDVTSTRQQAAKRIRPYGCSQ